MADVYTVTFIIIGILLSVPALLVGLNMLFPVVTDRACSRLRQTPSRCFLMGLGVTGAFGLWFAITVQVSFGPVQFLAYTSVLVWMGIGCLGAAGLACLLAERLGDISEPRSDLTHLLRGAVVYELACLVPLVGWFLFAPIVGITAVGAATFALLGWGPRRVSQETVRQEGGVSIVLGEQI